MVPKGHFPSIMVRIKMCNSLHLSFPSCLSPKFSGLIKVIIPSVNPVSERLKSRGQDHGVGES